MNQDEQAEVRAAQMRLLKAQADFYKALAWGVFMAMALCAGWLLMATGR